MAADSAPRAPLHPPAEYEATASRHRHEPRVQSAHVPAQSSHVQDAHHGRGSAWPHNSHADPGGPFRQRRANCTAVFGRDPHRDLCPWLLLGRREGLLGYAGGITPNATYEEVCSGRTGHAEAVLVVYDPAKVSYDQLLKVFWEHHDPTQGMRQGNDMGTQYRSAIYYADEDQRKAAEASRDAYQASLKAAGFGEITTEIGPAGPFYYAEDYHQQYLAKNVNGYCPNHQTGVKLPDDFVATPL